MKTLKWFDLHSTIQNPHKQREREWEIYIYIYREGLLKDSSMTNKEDTSSITPKSMTYRDTAYLKTAAYKDFTNSKNAWTIFLPF